VRLPRSSGHLR